jgi:hypothetical protein
VAAGTSYRGAPQEVLSAVMEPIFAADPDIIDLERRFNASHTELKWEYKFIEQAPEKKRKEHIIILFYNLIFLKY